MMDLSDERFGAVVEIRRKASEEIDIVPANPRDLNQEALTQLLATFPSVHHLNGIASSDSPPILLLCQPYSVSPCDVHPDNLLLWVWGWTGQFGASLTITAMVKGVHKAKSRILLNQGSPAFNNLKDGLCYLAFTHEGRIARSFKVNFLATPLARKSFLEHWSSVENHAVFLRDDGAHYWESIYKNDVWTTELSTRDQLSRRWLVCYKAVAKDLEDSVKEARAWGPFPGYLSHSFSSVMASFFRVLESSGEQLTPLLDFIHKELRNKAAMSNFIHDLKMVSQAENWGPYRHLPGMLLFTYLRSSIATNAGLALPWIDGTPGGSSEAVRHLELTPERFIGRDAVDDYWACHGYSVLINWGFLLKGDDVPISPPRLSEEGWRHVKLEASLTEIEATTHALLQEAVATKKYSIPPCALVELMVGPFAHAEVSEIGDEVYFVLRDADGRFSLVSVNPEKESWFLTVWGDESIPRKAEVEASLKLLLSAILRDFWVVELRETVFATRPIKKRLSRRYQNSDEPRIVYLPRVRYDSSPNLDRCSRDLSQQERRAHFVSAHLRRSEQPSEHQLRLGQLYGFHVPQGYTFVRPHERGKKARDVIYRSRSALQSLYTTIEEVSSKENIRPRWFQFERDVYALMKRLGYLVEHVAGSRSGDHGVDVYATKQCADTIENWVIQCKCYSPMNKVGPRIVRELIGTLSRYSDGTQGMIVTTSSFTTGAIGEAKLSNIKLVNGEQFSSLLKVL